MVVCFFVFCVGVFVCVFCLCFLFVLFLLLALCVSVFVLWDVTREYDYVSVLYQLTFAALQLGPCVN